MTIVLFVGAQIVKQYQQSKTPSEKLEINFWPKKIAQELLERPKLLKVAHNTKKLFKTSEDA